jgi:hypothetical protein
LCPATLLYLFMVSKSFWVEFFGSLRYRIISSANKDILTVSLPICIPLISSFCLIALARNSSTMLNKNEDLAIFVFFFSNFLIYSLARTKGTLARMFFSLKKILLSERVCLYHI